MTFNSSNEKEVLRQRYGEVYELVPNSKDPDWLNRACQAPVQCDVLLISGHFGGVFFGEKTSPTLDLKALETLACNQGCPSIDHAQNVYLMGCNTLATKSPDSRSIDEYLHVLVQDGFPRTLAEDVVSSRYLNFGLSMAERMELAFPHAKTIYGFSSKGPLGSLAAPRLKAALSGSGSLDERMTRAFQGTSFTLVQPTALSNEMRKNSCLLRSTDSNRRREGFSKLFRSASLQTYFDQVLEHLDDPVLLESWRAAASETQATLLLQVSNSIEERASSLVGLKAKLKKLKKNLGFLPSSEYFAQLSHLFQETISNGLDYLNTDQLCQIAKSEPNFGFLSLWLRTENEGQKAFLSRLSKCFNRKSTESLSILRSWASNSDDSFTRREALRASFSSWGSGEWEQLLKKSHSWSARDQSELRIDNQSNSCAQAYGADAQCRDSARWDCFKNLLPSFTGLTSCLRVAGEFETQTGLGADWACIEKFKPAVSLTACQTAASHYLQGIKYFPEKADDFLFYCSDLLRSQNALNRSECLGLTQAMQIPGNQIKENWNCMNQLKH